MLMRCDLSAVDPALHAHYVQNQLLQDREPSSAEHGAWARSGPGPIAFIGNTWTNGVTLAPEFKVVGATKLAALSYRWEPEQLGAWASQCSVRLIVTDATTLISYLIDVTSSPEGAVIDPKLSDLSANCSIVFQLKAGSRTGPLKSPPFIESYSVRAKYRSSKG